MSEKRQVSKLDRAKVALVTTHPFFATILLRRGLIESKQVPTAGVDARGNIYYNPDFVEKLSVQQLVFLLAHEVGHVIAQHPARVGARNKQKWNIAGDAWINDMLKAAGVGEFIEGGVDMPGSKDKTTDTIYNELLDEHGGRGGQRGGPGGIGEDIMPGGEHLTQEELDRIDAETRVEIAQAAQAAKAAGKMPAELQNIISGLIDPGTPWYDILERFMTSLVRGEYSWARPNKRYHSFAYLPSTGKVAQMGEIVVQVDVSGSISQLELDHYNGHLKRIVEQCNPERVHVIYTDTQVCRYDVFEMGEEFGLEFYSGGGTHMPAGFDWVAKEGIEPEAFICLTDGYTDFGVAPGYPVIWCISSDVVPTHGEHVPF